MVKTRLLSLMGRDSFEILQEIIWQWTGLLAQLVLVGCIAIAISDAFYGLTDASRIVRYVIIAALSIGARLIFIKLHFDSKINASYAVSDKLRCEIYSKILRVGNSYTTLNSKENLASMITDEMVMVEKYYAEFLPAIGYTFIATLTMAIILALINSIVMGVIAIALVGIIVGYLFAKKYEHFISIKYIMAALDGFAFIGAAIGLKNSLTELSVGNLKLEWAIITFFLCFEIFTPLKELGGILQDGIVTSKYVEKILDFVDSKESKQGKEVINDEPVRIVFENVKYSFGGQEVLKSASLLIPPKKITGLTGAKGAGKSTMASILTKRNKAYKGSVKINGMEISRINEGALFKDLTYITEESYIFKSSVRANLQLGNPKVTDKKMIGALKVVSLWGEIKEIGGLDLELSDDDILTRGQKQRLLLARALLKNSKFYVLDNVTNAIDDVSREIIMKLISQLAKDMGRTVLLISDEYGDLKGVDNVYALSEGMIDRYGKGNKSN